MWLPRPDYRAKRAEGGSSRRGRERLIVARAADCSLGTVTFATRQTATNRPDFCWFLFGSLKLPFYMNFQKTL
jgi:hypothetical protein